VTENQFALIILLFLPLVELLVVALSLIMYASRDITEDAVIQLKEPVQKGLVWDLQWVQLLQNLTGLPTQFVPLLIVNAEKHHMQLEKPMLRLV
jgi:hypothetical protein